MPDADPIGRVLLVDDEAEFVDTVQERLVIRGIDARVAHDGEEALALAAAAPFEVAVLDLKMPGLDGLQVLKKLRTDYPATQVIMLTGHGSAQEQQAAERIGVFAYLPKPQNIAVLAEMIRKASLVSAKLRAEICEPRNREEEQAAHVPPVKPEVH